MRSSELAKYLNKLFRPDEFICFGESAKDTAVCSLKSVLDGGAIKNFVALNPLDGQRDWWPEKEYHRADRPRRSRHNVTAHRNFLIEMDKSTLEEQVDELLRLEVPYATLVHSGGKSLHAVVALTEPVTADEYAEIVGMLHTVVSLADPSTKDPARFTRAPGAVREDTGREQELLDLRRRIPRAQLMGWLARYADLLEAAADRERRVRAAAEARRQAKAEAGGEGIDLMDERILPFLRGEYQPKSSRHNFALFACEQLMVAGIEPDDAQEILEQAFLNHGMAERVRAGEVDSIIKAIYFK